MNYETRFLYLSKITTHPRYCNAKRSVAVDFTVGLKALKRR